LAAFFATPDRLALRAEHTLARVIGSRVELQRCASSKSQLAPRLPAGPVGECGKMIQLVFSVCSIVEGAACHELPPVPLKEGASMVRCLMASQVEGAKWAAAHPNQYIRNIRCEPAGRFAKT
jgi:hypothetical protein